MLKTLSQYFLLAILFSSCHEGREIGETVKNNKIITLNDSCLLSVDTFSYKGIKIGSNIEEVLKKFTFNSSKSTQSTKVRSYNLKDGATLTIFGKKMQNLTLETYDDKIYSISIEIIEEDTGLSLSEVMNALAERYNATRCLRKKPFDIKESSIMDECLELRNKNLSIDAFIIPSDFVENENTHPLLKNGALVSKMKRQCVIIVEDLKIKELAEVETKNFDKKEKTKAKNDI